MSGTFVCGPSNVNVGPSTNYNYFATPATALECVRIQDTQQARFLDAYNVATSMACDPDTAAIVLSGSISGTFSFAGLPSGFTVTALRVGMRVISGINGSAARIVFLTNGGAEFGAALNLSLSMTDFTRVVTPTPSTIDAFLNTFGFNMHASGFGGNSPFDVDRLWIEGDWDLVFTAWVIPDPATSPDGTGEAGTGAPAAVSGPYSNDVRNACAVPTPSHVVISPTSPGAGYVVLGTPPTPVVDSVTPPAGTTNGGQAVTIRGAAFSDDATVTFAGVAATSVVVVSQFEITCVTPAHAAGSADVVVTNGDGSHS